MRLLFKRPIATDHSIKTHAGTGPDLPQQRRALGLHLGNHQAGASRCWFHGLQTQKPL